jgi:site-specific DNA-cytosine methylase
MVVEMKILVACESSQVVTKAFRKYGHDAYSCDYLQGEYNPDWHYQCDVLTVLNLKWDLIIAHPPCTDLSVSGARYFKQKQASGQQAKSIAFFLQFVNLDCPKVAIENPVGIMSRIYRKPDQYIQPYQFGNPESKLTCLWLKGLKPLKPTNILTKPECGYWNNQTPSGQNKLGPSSDRWKIRSRTYEGIADAMAQQWG